MGAAVQQNQLRLILMKQQELNDFLLEVTSKYFTDNVQIEEMVSGIVVISTFLYTYPYRI